MTIKIRVKGGPGSGDWGHSGRPGLEGGAIPKGGSRRVYGVPGKRTQSFPKGKTIPPVPELSQSRSGTIPPHTKGDTSGTKAYNSWKSSAGNVSEADDAKMKSWFGERAAAMEFNLNIPTVVPGQRDDEDEKKEPEKKAEEKKPEEKKKTGKAKKAPAEKKEPKGKAPAKPKQVKVVKKKGPTDEERAKILKAVGVKPEMYTALQEAEKLLKAGDTPSGTLLGILMESGLVSFDFGKGVSQPTIPLILQGLADARPGDIINIRMSSIGQSLIRAIEGGDAIAAQRLMDKLEAAKKKAGSKSWKIHVKGGPGSGAWGHAGRPGLRGGGRASGMMQTALGYNRRFDKLNASKPKFRPGRVPQAPRDSTIGREEFYRASEVLNKVTARNHDGVLWTLDEMKTAWETANYTARSDTKRNIVANLSDATGVPEEDVNNFICQWARTSNDNDMRSLAMQEDASKAFGVPLSDWQKDKIAYVRSKSDDGYGGLADKPLLPTNTQHKILKEMYKQTQADLQKKGFKPGDTVRLYRGVVQKMPDTNAVQYKGNAIESWSVGYDTARNFATGYGTVHGTVFSMNVPIENILSSAATGFGCLDEGEFVIFGTIANQVAKIEF